MSFSIPVARKQKLRSVPLGLWNRRWPIYNINVSVKAICLAFSLKCLISFKFLFAMDVVDVLLEYLCMIVIGHSDLH